MKNLHILPYGSEFEFVLARKDGSLPTAIELSAVERMIIRYFPEIDFEFSRWYKELQSPVHHNVNGFREFVQKLQILVSRFEEKTGYILIPFSGIFDQELSEEFVSYVQGRDYYQQAWQKMKPEYIPRSDIYFNKVGATHISLAVPELDVVRLFNLANLLITPLSAIASCYGGDGHCLRGLYWQKIHSTVRPLYIQSIEEYNNMVHTEGVGFTQGKKAWPWIRIKDDINSSAKNNEKLYRLELGMLDILWNKNLIINIPEFIVRLMSILHYDLPNLIVQAFDPKIIQVQFQMMCLTRTDWRSLPVVNFQNKKVSIQEFVIELLSIVDNYHDKPECSQVVRDIVVGDSLTCSEMLKNIFPTYSTNSQSTIRLHCYNEFIKK